MYRRPTFLVLIAITGSAVAQESDNVVLRARDAFGERIGNEQVGLYNEQQVRGFSLGDAAAYRLEGSYFLRDYQLPDAILAGVSVKVGVNAARTDYPSPSGVVDYRLKTSDPGDRKLSINFGLRDNNTKVFELAGSVATADGRYGVAGGALLQPQIRYGNGTAGDTQAVGLVPQWQPNENVNVRAVLSAERSYYNGDIGVASPVAAAPPKYREENAGAPYAEVLRYSYNAGMLADARLGEAWSLRTSAFYADTKRSPQDFTLLTIGPDRMTDAAFFRTVKLHGRVLTGEALLKRRLQTGSVDHEFSIAARGRRGRVLNENLSPIRVARFTIDSPVYPAPPAFGVPVGGLKSDVDQSIASVGYAGDYDQRFELRGGLHRVHYVKSVRQPTGTATQRTENSLVYNASLVAAATNRLTLFANTVKGIEESGTAPQNALNRSEILPPVTATEYEVGARFALTNRLSLSLAGFSTTKLISGLRPDGVFTLVGNVRHRGGEVSLSGEIVPGTSIVIGAMAMQPRLSGVLVQSGAIGRRPVGVASTVGVASVDHQLPWFPGISVDSRVNWNGARAADPRNTFETKGFALWSAGARYNFSHRDHPMTLRLLVSNLLTNRPYSVGSSGLFQQFNGTTYRLTLRVGLLDE